MNKLTDARRAAIVKCLVDGSSIRATARITGASKATILKLLVEVGEVCSIYQDHVLRNLPTTRFEIDEVWAFVGAKQRNATVDTQGDIWTYTAVDSDSKLIISWLVGRRSHTNAREFLEDVADRVPRRAQLTTDAHPMYAKAVENAFGERIDYAQLVKQYGPSPDQGPARRYSPLMCTGILKVPMIGAPARELVSTSYVERANLSVRMGVRRFTRLTNGFSKKAGNHAHAVSLYFMYYNFCRPHQTLTKAHANHYPTTPAMAAGVSDHVWKVEEIVELLNPARLLG
jgi:IS1 family transposase